MPRAEERYTPSAAIDVDRILPDNWYEYWELYDKVFVSAAEADAARYAQFANEPDAKTAAVNRRERLKGTIGKLTLVHYSISRSAQNREFEVIHASF